MGKAISFSVVVPGRVELLGKHTDYAGGASVTMATTACLRADVRLGAGDLLVHDADGGGSWRGEPGRGWTIYPDTVFRRMTSDFGPMPESPAIRLQSSIPRASGMSSSSALVTALIMAWAAANRVQERDAFSSRIRSMADLADYAAAVESGYPFRGLGPDHGVGIRGGGEDHVGVLMSRAGRVGCFRYMPTRSLWSVPWPSRWRVVVAGSGVVAAKAGNAMAAYNRASDLARDAAVALGGDAGSRLGDLVSLDLDRQAIEGLPAPLRRRVDHFLLEEVELIPAAKDALEDAHLAQFSRAVNRSHQGAVDLLGNQVDETMALAQLARDIGAPCASAFGAGFGGAVYAITDDPDVESFAETWLGTYRRRFPSRADASWVRVERPASAARVSGDAAERFLDSLN